MPATGPVYQPTTVSYEQQGEWTSPTGFLAQTSASIGRARCLQWLALALGLLAIAAGLIMIFEGSLDFTSTEQEDVDKEVASETGKTDMVVIITGCLVLFVGLALIAIYIKLSTRRKGCPCLLTKEQRIARQLRDTQSVNGQTMNPSTDFLVTAQYAPVSEIAYQPPAVSEEEETRKLMGSDNKDCNDESERILDKDPRIVLRPLSKVEESQDSEAF